MAIEKKWASVPPQSITSNGTQDGHITVADSTLFFVKMKVTVFSDDVSPMQLEVKRVNNINDLELGSPGNINSRSNLTSILTSDNPMISASEQDRPAISQEDVLRASYANEPAVALRSLPVNKLGNAIDSVQGVDGKTRMAVDAEVNVEVNNVQLLTKPYAAGTEANPTSVQQVFVTYSDTVGGTPVQRVTINYVDATRNAMVNFQREEWNGSTWIPG